MPLKELLAGIMPTIDDLPLGDHNKYAQNVEQTSKEPLQYRDDKHIAGPARTEVNIPSYPSHIRSFSGEDLTNVTWSDFPELNSKRSSCFGSAGLSSRFGDTPQLTALKQRLDNMGKEKE